MNYKTKNKLGTAVIAGTLLFNSVVPSYAGLKEINESVKEIAGKACKYVKNHKWYFIGGTAALAAGIVYSNSQKRYDPAADEDKDGYPNEEEKREGADPNNKDSHPQDDGDVWALSINSFNPARAVMPSKLENKLSKLEISGPIVPIYINLGKNSSVCSEIGKDRFRVCFNYKF